MSWSPYSWRDCPIQQQPGWDEHPDLTRVREELHRSPPLVVPAGTRRLQRDLERVAKGEAFLLQGGDCAESFSDFSEETILGLTRILLQMAVTLMLDAQRPIVKVARLAGQFAKPRSSSIETKEGTELPSYRGDMVNADPFDPKSRTPNPKRMLRAYAQSAATLNYLQGLASTGYAALTNIRRWNSEFLAQGAQFERYQEVISRIESTIRFVEASGLGDHRDEALNAIDIYTSHEALLLDYEEAFVREGIDGLPYVQTAHMLWVGNRTRQLDGAHIEFVRGLGNPIGIKVDGSLKPDELLKLLSIVDPDQRPGRITLISRMGAAKVREELPPLVRTVQAVGWPVIWSCDPMHGNTVKTSDGYKTRKVDDIIDEIRGFFEVVRSEGAYPGGVHLEMTGHNVTECMGGSDTVEEDHLVRRYHTLCDPRLNANQALELAMLIADLFEGVPDAMKTGPVKILPSAG